MKYDEKFLPIMLEKKEEISMSHGEEMKIAVLLSMLCFEKNVGNRIKLGLKNSKNASWRGLLGLPHKKYEKLIEKGAPGLWHCEGDDIIVDLYSVEMEDRRNAKREQTSNAGKASAEARKERANQQGGNSTDVQRTFNNIDKTQLNSDVTNKFFDDDDDSGQARRPENTHEVEEFLREHEKHMSREQIEECASDFWKMNEDSTWKGADGLPLKNWKGAARAYADKWKQRTRPQHRSGNARSMDDEGYKNRRDEYLKQAEELDSRTDEQL